MAAILLPDTVTADEINLRAKHPLQSFQWGQAKHKLGNRIARFGDKNNVFTLTIHPIPGFSSYAVGYIPRSALPSQETLSVLYEYARNQKLIFIKIEPDVQWSKDTEAAFISSSENLVRSPHPLFPDWTIINDLTPNEDKLLAGMKQKTRYNIRLAKRKGVVVQEENTQEGFKTFSNLYFETTKRQRYFGHSPLYHETVWNALKPDIAHILIARYRTKALATFELFHFKNTVYYPYGGTSIENRNVMAANLIMWESLLFAKRLGAKRFDMWGALGPSHQNQSGWAGFTRFKKGYGGKLTRMIGSYDLVAYPALYALYNKAQIIRRHALTFYRLFS